jgi:hypothetical protein
MEYDERQRLIRAVKNLILHCEWCRQKLGECKAREECGVYHARKSIESMIAESSKTRKPWP